MKIRPFKRSESCTIGIEIELQIINRDSFNLTDKSLDIMKHFEKEEHPWIVKPEFTQNMIEINSSPHHSMETLEKELLEIKAILVEKANQLNINLSGGGMHLFQKNKDNKIFPDKRYQKISDLYGFIVNQFIVFDLHIHIGCPSSNKSIYLAHVLARYLPQFIALSASSPFNQGIDTTFQSNRLIFNSKYPTSGHLPLIKNWKSFCKYYEKIYKLGIVKDMKDLYWDIRPRNIFGTVEFRICDSPLTIKKSIMMAAFAQMLAHLIFQQPPNEITEDLYHVYNFNRFQAARYGFDGDFINPFNKTHTTIQEDILNTIESLIPHAEALDTVNFLKEIKQAATLKLNDASWLKENFAKSNSLINVVKKQCDLWMS